MERTIHLTRAGPPADHGLFAGPAIVLSLALGKFLFHLLTAGRYGIFRDELYYLACSEHLDFGYVDQPPLIAFVAWVARHLFGESLVGLRLLPALAGAATVWLTGKLAREMGGGVFAQALAALAIIAAPIYLLVHHWLTMNAFEALLWLACAWCIVRAINRSDPHYWLWFGVLLGLGMENKYSAAFFALAVLVALLLTPQRRFLSNAWIWIGAFCSLLIFLPNLIWLIRHDFPFLELMHNIRGSGRDVVRGPVAFIADQAMLMNPILFPLWLGGLGWLFLNRDGGRYRILGWIYLLMLIAFIALKGKNYYLSAAYPMLLAAGAVGFANLTRARGRWSRLVYVGLIVAATCFLAPTVAPVLPPETYVWYQKAIGLEPPRAENQPTVPYPSTLPMSSDGKTWPGKWGEFTTRFRPSNAWRPRSLPTVMARRERSIFLEKSTGCRKRSAIIKTTGIGGRGSIRARASSCLAAMAAAIANISPAWRRWGAPIIPTRGAMSISKSSSAAT